MAAVESPFASISQAMKGPFDLLVALFVVSQSALAQPVGEGDGSFGAVPRYANGELGAPNHDLQWRGEHSLHGWGPSSPSSTAWSGYLPMHQTNLPDVQPAHATYWHEVLQQRVPIANELGASQLQSESHYPTLDFPGTTPPTSQPEVGMGTAVVPPSPFTPSRSGPLPQVEFLLTNGKPIGEWEDNMRTALGNPFLQFHALDGRHRTSSRLFVAQHGMLELDHHPTSAPLSQLLSGSDEWHFTGSLKYARTVNLRDVNLGQSHSRVIVYLNSRLNTQYLSEQYFLNQLHFLPIDPQKLRWDVLNNLFTNRARIYVFPPRERHGLPLLVAPHNMGTGKVRSIMEFTGRFEDDSQLVSLWSPLLHEKQRTTLVFYGIGQLDYRNAAATSKYLDNLADAWEYDVRWGAQYYLGKDWPHGWFGAPR